MILYDPTGWDRRVEIQRFIIPYSSPRVTVSSVMISYQPLLAGLVLFSVVSVGIVLHELLHGIFLRAAGVSFDIRWFHGDTSGRFRALFFGTWASVSMRSIPNGLSPWKIRAASLSPLLLTAPLVGITAGAIPDPFAGDNLVLQLAVIGWLACAIPSPADFSLFWYAGSVIDDAEV